MGIHIIQTELCDTESELFIFTIYKKKKSEKHILMCFFMPKLTLGQRHKAMFINCSTVRPQIKLNQS